MKNNLFASEQTVHRHIQLFRSELISIHEDDFADLTGGRKQVLHLPDEQADDCVGIDSLVSCAAQGEHEAGECQSLQFRFVQRDKQPVQGVFKGEVSGAYHFEAKDPADAFVIDILGDEAVLYVPEIQHQVNGQCLQINAPVEVQGANQVVWGGDVTTLKRGYSEVVHPEVEFGDVAMEELEMSITPVGLDFEAIDEFQGLTF